MRWRGALLRRALVEHRAIVVPLALVLLANVLVYAFMVYPLSQRVGSVTERTREAEIELKTAQALYDRATGTLTGKARAAEELERFYAEVLPADLSSARRLVHPGLFQLARQANVKLGNMTSDDERDAESTLTRLRMEMTIEGSYQGIRRFIHQLEQAPEFVVIDQVTLEEDVAEEGLLTVGMELSTYFRETAP